MSRSPEPDDPPAPENLRSIAEIFGIDVLAATRLPPFKLEHRPVRPPPGHRARSLRSAEVDRRLQELRVDVEAGVPDARIASRTGLSRGQVRYWRRRHGLAGKTGRAALLTEVAFVLHNPLSREVRRRIHETVTRGGFSKPEYLLRTPLHYDHFARMVVALVEQGFSSAYVASGLGVDVRDVEVAKALAAREAGR